MRQLLVILSMVYLTASLFTYSSAHIFEITSTFSLIILWNVIAMTVTAIILFRAYYQDRKGHDISANTLQRA